MPYYHFSVLSYACSDMINKLLRNLAKDLGFNLKFSYSSKYEYMLRGLCKIGHVLVKFSSVLGQNRLLSSKSNSGESESKNTTSLVLQYIYLGMFPDFFEQSPYKNIIFNDFPLYFKPLRCKPYN